jgi:hypothetical protein
MTMIELLQNCWGRRPRKPARTDGEPNMPMRPGAARQTAALDGRVVQPDASQGAMRLRALEVEALALLTIARASAGDDYALPSRPESRKRDIVGWITVAAILYGGAFATLCGGVLLDPWFLSRG